ncbi:hypothetical protein WN51_11375 [Melipona quadrifasciata]|uniref:Uncharacterized protein n=1 Tax=Melipona quadrifasciata TaxID=166423 RepID=A0A0M9A948_9HYME|nr:hypothetical protein WN51_11375 [Melipona quadrifasciata]
MKEILSYRISDTDAHETSYRIISSLRGKIILAIAQYQTTPLLLEVYPTPSHESRDPNQPIANFRCISVAPEEVRFSGLPPLKSPSMIIYFTWVGNELAASARVGQIKIEAVKMRNVGNFMDAKQRIFEDLNVNAQVILASELQLFGNIESHIEKKFTSNYDLDFEGKYEMKYEKDAWEGFEYYVFLWILFPSLNVLQCQLSKCSGLGFLKSTSTSRKWLRASVEVLPISDVAANKAECGNTAKMRAPTSLAGSYDTSVWGKESLPSAPSLMSLGSDSETKRKTIASLPYLNSLPKTIRPSIHPSQLPLPSASIHSIIT